MISEMYIGSSPSEESCVQVTADGATIDAQKHECQAYIEALRRLLGPEPEGARLRIKSQPHDFGTYYDVICRFDENDEQAVEYAFKCESSGPLTWAEVGMVVPNEQEQRGTNPYPNTPRPETWGKWRKGKVNE